MEKSNLAYIPTTRTRAIDAEMNTAATHKLPTLPLPFNPPHIDWTSLLGREEELHTMLKVLKDNCRIITRVK